MDFDEIKSKLQQGMPFKQIAEYLNINPSTLRSRCHKKGLYPKDIINSTNLKACSKLCPKCNNLKDKSEFYPRPNRLNKLSSYCKGCTNKLSLDRKRELKEKCVAYKGDKCSKCGYNTCIDALHFHHLDPSKKEFGIAALTFSVFTDKVKTELDKCIMVCANCHSEIHYELMRI